MANPKLSTRVTQFNTHVLSNSKQGIVCESFDRYAGFANKALSASGTINASQAFIFDGDIINNLSTYVDTPAGTGVTLCKLGIWDQNGKLLAGTADFSASLVANTWITAPLAGGSLSFTSDQMIYLGILGVWATTAPQFAGNAIAGNFGSQYPVGPPLAISKSGQADLVDIGFAGAPATIYYIVAS